MWPEKARGCDVGFQNVFIIVETLGDNVSIFIFNILFNFRYFLGFTIDKISYIGLIFLTHWPLDRYGLGAKWCRYVKGFDVGGAFKSGNPVLIALAIFIPIAVDNTLHLALMWPVVYLFL